jgi:spore coat protein U domain-containing protein, fimbrial subunit CupE1/2/3/6
MHRDGGAVTSKGRWGRDLLRATLGIALALAAARPAAAAAKCTITTAGSVAFGTYNVFSVAPLDSTGVLQLTCNGAARPITVDLSSGNSPTYSPRYMLTGAQQLNYNLYLDAARTLIWGDGTGGSSHYGPIDPPNGGTNLTIYGRIPPGQDVPAGTYADTLVVTVNF